VPIQYPTIFWTLLNDDCQKEVTALIASSSYMYHHSGCESEARLNSNDSINVLTININTSSDISALCALEYDCKNLLWELKASLHMTAISVPPSQWGETRVFVTYCNCSEQFLGQLVWWEFPLHEFWSRYIQGYAEDHFGHMYLTLSWYIEWFIETMGKFPSSKAKKILQGHRDRINTINGHDWKAPTATQWDLETPINDEDV